MSNPNFEFDERRERGKKRKFSKRHDRDSMDVDTWIPPWDRPIALENLVSSASFGSSSVALGDPVFESKQISGDVSFDETLKYEMPEVDFGGLGPTSLEVSFDETSSGR